MRKISAIACFFLLIGLVLGFFAGQWALEHKWQTATRQLTPQDVERSRQNGADPSPPAGTQVLIPMPLKRARLAMQSLTAHDPVIATLGSVGRDEGVTELHLNLSNQGTCEVTGLQGIAYGFDAWGKPSTMNQSGENYVAFTDSSVHVAPGASAQHVSSLHHSDTASLVVAQIDRATCADGTEWKR